MNAGKYAIMSSIALPLLVVIGVIYRSYASEVYSPDDWISLLFMAFISFVPFVALRFSDRVGLAFGIIACIVSYVFVAKSAQTMFICTGEQSLLRVAGNTLSVFLSWLVWFVLTILVEKFIAKQKAWFRWLVIALWAACGFGVLFVFMDYF